MWWEGDGEEQWKGDGKERWEGGEEEGQAGGGVELERRRNLQSLKLKEKWCVHIKMCSNAVGSPQLWIADPGLQQQQENVVYLRAGGRTWWWWRKSEVSWHSFLLP